MLIHIKRLRTGRVNNMDESYTVIKETGVDENGTLGTVTKGIIESLEDILEDERIIISSVKYGKSENEIVLSIHGKLFISHLNIKHTLNKFEVNVQRFCISYFIFSNNLNKSKRSGKITTNIISDIRAIVGEIAKSFLKHNSSYVVGLFNLPYIGFQYKNNC